MFSLVWQGKKNRTLKTWAGQMQVSGVKLATLVDR